MKTYKPSTFLCVNIIVALTNFWIWRIIKIDLLLGLALILLNAVFIYLIDIKFNRKFFLITTFLSLFISIKILVSGFDYNLTVLTPDQQKQLNERHGYFATDLGNLFQNRYMLRFYKDVYPYMNVYGRNIFNSLSPNLYFFANHPREREKVEEFSMYPSILIIPFLVGLIYLLNSSGNLIFGYVLFALLITGFVKQTYIFGSVLFFPLINLIISIGFLKIYRIIKK